MHSTLTSPPSRPAPLMVCGVSLTHSQNKPGSHECVCMDGYKGTSCFDNCATKPCQNGGTCTVITATYCRVTDLIECSLSRTSLTTTPALVWTSTLEGTAQRMLWVSVQ